MNRVHPLVGLGVTVPTGDGPFVHGIVADIEPFSRVGLLGDDGKHYQSFLTFCVWDDPEEARQRLRQGGASPRVEFVLLSNGKDLGPPVKSSEDAAGFDLRAALEPSGCVLLPSRRRIVPCGFAMALPPGYEAQIRARSGLAAHFGIGVLNGPGTIDADYRGEICVILVNHGPTPFPIARGDRIAQLVIAQVPRVKMVEVERLSGTVRGEQGFGSTGRS